MFRIKYFEEFEGGYPFLVILCDKEGLRAAHEFFLHRKSGYLNDPALAESSDIVPLSQEHCYLNAQECNDISEHFKNLSEAAHPCHAYFDTQALGDKIEIMISYNEYGELS